MHRTGTLSRAAGVLAVAALAATTLAGCGGSDGDSASGSTIKVGNISGITGPFPLGDASAGAQAYFDSVNAEGGINGKKIELIVRDDKTDPTLSARAARDLATQEKVVAFVGDLTIVGCGVNRPVLEKNNLRSIMVASDAACFEQPNISPVNAGQETDWKITLVYAAEKLKKKNICAIFTNSATLSKSNDRAVAYFEKTTGQKLAMLDKTLSQNSNLPAMMANAKKANCDVVLTDGTANQAAPLVKARDQQKLDAAMIFQGSMYDTAAGQSLGAAKDVYTIAEMEPFTGDAAIVKTMKADLDKAGVKVNALAQFGWEAAYIFGGVVKGIDGPVTRDSVGKALLALESLDTEGMTATPYSFGPGDAHNPNRGGKLVKLDNGAWVPESTEWSTLS